ncbi:UNVERIFIED_CONTAM: hypothetical protein RMT77_010421 [Armadillidium vulgare]
MPPKSYYHEGGETFLQSLFTHFSYFAFDKAKEQADRERDVSKNQCSPVWTTLLSCVSQLAIVEKLYMNLLFLTPKGFLRKESSVRLSYETILTELVEIEKRRGTTSNTSHASNVPSNGTAESEKTEKGCSEGVLLHLSSHLILFIQARLLMLSFYEKLILWSSNKYVNYDDALQYIDEIIKKNSSSFHHPILAPIKTTFTCESEINSHLLGSLKAMQELQFLPALLHLHDAQSKLLSWQAIIQNKESKKYNFLKSPSLPALYQWLWRAKASFVSKFSLYFYEVLSGQASASETKNLLTKLTCDYVSKIQSFQRKIDAQSVCIVLKASPHCNMRSPGYNFPSDEHAQINLDHYLTIFSYPVKPLSVWPSIVMQLSNMTTEELYDKVISHYDVKVGITLFFCQIEPNIFLVVTFENKKPEKENFVKEFLLDIAVQLSCNKVFAALKPN